MIAYHDFSLGTRAGRTIFSVVNAHVPPRGKSGNPGTKSWFRSTARIQTAKMPPEHDGLRPDQTGDWEGEEGMRYSILEFFAPKSLAIRILCAP